jgi:hypothetical protein
MVLRMGISALRYRRLAWGVAAVTGVLVLACLTTHAVQLHRLVTADASLRATRQQESKQSHAVREVRGVEPYLLSHPVSPGKSPGDPTSLFTRAQRSAAAAGVPLVFISSATILSTERTLGHTEFGIAVSGTYAQVKGLLAETLERSADRVLRHLALRRLNSSAELRAEAVVWLLLPPAEASGAGR